MKEKVQQALTEAVYQKIKEMKPAVTIARWILDKCGGNKELAFKIHSAASFKWQMEFFEGNKEHPGAAAKVKEIKKKDTMTCSECKDSGFVELIVCSHCGVLICSNCNRFHECGKISKWEKCLVCSGEGRVAGSECGPCDGSGVVFFGHEIIK